MAKGNDKLGSLTARLMAIDYDRLPISDYNKRYIRNLKPALAYFMRIYEDCLRRGTQGVNLPLSDLTLIDYGGGSGFLSMAAKRVGIGRVIYIDLNPLSAQTIQVLKEEAGIGPDIILQGDSKFLADWCAKHRISPQLLVATDLIEHVYDLDAFFKDLHQINGSMPLIFTTASSPFNPYVKRRLHKLMDGCERGTLESPNYHTLRHRFISGRYPALTPEEVETWARNTRGMTYDDIQEAIESNRMPTPPGPHNTCDPANGNWTERILPISSYKKLLAPHDLKLSVAKGFYNTYRSSRAMSLLCEGLNLLIRHSGPLGLLIAPFIILVCRKK